MKGVVHLHSTYSDGELSPEELRAEYMALGYRFACLTDHAEYFDADRLAAYRAECDRLSDASFRFIAGLEYDCRDRMHILCLGATPMLDSREPLDVIVAIEAAGGVSVIAHPRTQDFARIEAFEPPATGIEVWNSKYDGRYAPRVETFAMLRRIRGRHPQVRGFYGQDRHFRKQFKRLHVDLADAAHSDASILCALREGRFVGVHDDIQLASDGMLRPAVTERFERLGRRSRSFRGVVRRTKGILDRMGLSVPPGVKAQLRRLF